MPNNIGGYNGRPRILDIQPTTEVNDIQSNSSMDGSDNSQPSAVDGFGAVNRGGGSGNLGLEHLYNALENASNKIRNNGPKVETGTYRINKKSSSHGNVTRDSNNSTTDWKSRSDWKGSTNKETEGLGTKRGPRVDNSDSKSLKMGGFWSRDNAIGTQAKVSGSVEGKY